MQRTSIPRQNRPGMNMFKNNINPNKNLGIQISYYLDIPINIDV